MPHRWLYNIRGAQDAKFSVSQASWSSIELQILYCYSLCDNLHFFFVECSYISLEIKIKNITVVSW